MKIHKHTKLGKDERRKQHHWRVTVVYTDGERFARTYIARDKAYGFAGRQRKSPVVKMARVMRLSLTGKNPIVDQQCSPAKLDVWSLSFLRSEAP